MENASKALIMAATVLLGVMILSIGVFLFQTFGQYSAEAEKKQADKQIAQFNNQFFKYQTGSDGQIFINKVHDLISCANRAKENNEYYEYGSGETRKNGNYYIQVSVPGYTNFEKQSEEVYLRYIKSNLYNADTTFKQYVCSKIEINKSTNRVNFVSFELKK